MTGTAAQGGGDVEAGARTAPDPVSAPPARGGRDRGPRTLTASEAAALIGVSVATIRGWADRGLLPSHRTVGGHRRFELDELREWLSHRGAPAPEGRRLRRSARELPPCPRLARELNLRTEAIVERVLRGFDPSVPTPLATSTPAALRRVAVRFLRVVASALESGRPAASFGRIEVAGLRGGLQGGPGASVLIEHMRVATAILAEAEAVVAEGATDEEHALATLHSVIDFAQVSVLRGFEQARAERGRPRPAP